MTGWRPNQCAEGHCRQVRAAGGHCPSSDEAGQILSRKEVLLHGVPGGHASTAQLCINIMRRHAVDACPAGQRDLHQCAEDEAGQILSRKRARSVAQKVALQEERSMSCVQPERRSELYFMVAHGLQPTALPLSCTLEADGRGHHSVPQLRFMTAFKGLLTDMHMCSLCYYIYVHRQGKIIDKCIPSKGW